MDEPAEISAAKQRLINWKHDVEQARHRKPFAPKQHGTPARVPQAARRLMALLEWIGTGGGHQLHAIKRQPPLTPDMRTLIAKGYCRLERRFPIHYSQDLAASLRRSTAQRVTRIVMTEAGRKALANADVSDDDRDYVRAALQTMTLM